MYLTLKFALSALIIVAVSEIAKRSSTLGALIASLPLTSLLAILWLYVETKDLEKIAGLSSEIFWLVIPSLAFFALLPFLLKAQFSFGVSILLSLSGMFISYGVLFYLRRFLNVE